MPKTRSTRSTRETEKTVKPAGGEKNPGAPKRASSAYMFFSQDWREKIKAENPGIGFGQIGRLLGVKWKELNDEEKKPYADRAAADQVRYEKEKTAFLEKEGSADEEE